MAHRGDVEAASDDSRPSAMDVAADLGEYFVGMTYAQSSLASLAAGDIASAHDAAASGLAIACAWASPSWPWRSAAFNSVEVALARGDLATAREQWPTPPSRWRRAIT